MRVSVLYPLPEPKRDNAAARARLGTAVRWLGPVLTVLLVLGAWQLVAALQLYPQFILPTPRAVAEQFYEVTLGDARVRLWPNLSTTAREVLGGLAVGLSAALVVGYVSAKSRLVESLLSPLVVAFQATPVVAYAPLLVIWFGSGPESKILTSALIVFFPALSSTVVGLRSAPRGLRDLMRSLQATRWQMFIKLEVPAALPVILSGLKVSATLAVIGAVVGEFVNAEAGLGYLIDAGRSSYNTPLVFVAVFTLTALALTLYGAVALLEHVLLAWRRRANA